MTRFRLTAAGLVLAIVAPATALAQDYTDSESYQRNLVLMERAVRDEHWDFLLERSIEVLEHAPSDALTLRLAGTALLREGAADAALMLLRLAANAGADVDALIVEATALVAEGTFEFSGLTSGTEQEALVLFERGFSRLGWAVLDSGAAEAAAEIRTLLDLNPVVGATTEGGVRISWGPIMPSTESARLSVALGSVGCLDVDTIVRMVAGAPETVRAECVAPAFLWVDGSEIATSANGVLLAVGSSDAIAVPPGEVELEHSWRSLSVRESITVNEGDSAPVSQPGGIVILVDVPDAEITVSPSTVRHDRVGDGFVVLAPAGEAVQVVAEADGRDSFNATMTPQAGQVSTIRVTADLMPPTAAWLASAEEQSRIRRGRALIGTGAGFGAAGAALIVLGRVSASRANDSYAEYQNAPAVEMLPYLQNEVENEDAKALGFTAGGAAAAVLGVTLCAVGGGIIRHRDRTDQSITVSPTVGPSRVGLHVQF